MTVPLRPVVVFVVIALAVVAVGGYVAGVRHAQQATWHTVTVDLADVAADETGPQRLISIRADGWTYAIENSVEWLDARGTLHDHGWPDCLEPAHPGFMSRNHQDVRIRFAEVTTRTEAVGWRPVLMVDCRPPGAIGSA